MSKLIGLIDFKTTEYPQQIEADNFEILISMIARKENSLYHIRMLVAFSPYAMQLKYLWRNGENVYNKKISVSLLRKSENIWKYDLKSDMWKSMNSLESYIYSIDDIKYHFETNQLEFIGWYALPCELQSCNIEYIERKDVKKIFPALYSSGFAKRINVSDENEMYLLDLDKSLNVNINQKLITYYFVKVKSDEELILKYGKKGYKFKKRELGTFSKEYYIDRYKHSEEKIGNSLIELPDTAIDVLEWKNGKIRLEESLKSKYILLCPENQKIKNYRVEKFLNDNYDIIICNYSVQNKETYIAYVERTVESFLMENDEYLTSFIIIKKKWLNDGMSIADLRETIKSNEMTKKVSNSEGLVLDVRYKKLDNKLITFYLPQYHETEENNMWWGKGFTEWTNVKKAEPQFEGHHQPRIPGELGYYSLDGVGTQKKQIQLAKEMGIFGFCYYYYWFNGKRLLRKPLDQVLEHQELDFPFCICWANEPWTRSWDGKEHDILIDQVHTPESDEKFIYDVISILKDSRYIKVNGKPLLIVYRIELFPNPEKTIRKWRKICKKEGIADIYIAVVQSFDCIDNRIYGADASIEFPPHKMPVQLINDRMKDKIYSGFEGNIYSYKELVEHMELVQKREYEYIPGTMREWDNTARKGKKAHIFAEYSDDLYKKWLLKNCVYADMYSKEKFVFINAWNEWAEGTYLEPEGK